MGRKLTHPMEVTDNSVMEARNDPEQRERDDAFAALEAQLKRGAEQDQRNELCDGEVFMEELLARLA